MPLDDIAAALRADGIPAELINGSIELPYGDEAAIVITPADGGYRIYDDAPGDNGDMTTRHHVTATDETTAAYVAALMYRQGVDDHRDAEAEAEAEEKAVDDLVKSIAKLNLKADQSDHDRGYINGIADALITFTGITPDELDELIEEFEE